MFHVIQLLLLSKIRSVQGSAKAFYTADTRNKERKVNNWDNQNSHVKSLLRECFALYCWSKKKET